MKKITALAVFCVASTLTSAHAAEYSVDKSHSRIGFQVRHLLSKVSGDFKEFEGEFAFDPEKLNSAKVNMSIKAPSINTNEPKRDDHLRAADFLHTEKFPSIQFVGKKLSANGDKKYKLEGDFTLHGVTKPVTFDVEYLGSDKDTWGNQRAGFTATTVINRKDYGIQFNKVLESGRLLVGDEVTVNIEIEGIEKPSKK